MTLAFDRLPLLLSDTAIKQVLALLNGEGEEARVIGGAVRDALLGLPVKDIDIATTAPPEEVMRRAQAAHIHFIPTGLTHGTITLVIDKTPFEITSLREDIDTYGRHAKVRFGRDFERDAHRRDFTINALSLDPSGQLYDYVGGIDDLTARRICFIGDPRTRIREDYLRILRFFRFHAAFAKGPIDPHATQAIIDLKEGMRALSKERIHAEIFKLLAAPRALDVCHGMAHMHIWEILAARPFNLHRLEALILMEHREQLAPHILLRLFALFIQTPTDVPLLKDQFRLSNQETRFLAHLAHALEFLEARHPLTLLTPPTDHELRCLLFFHPSTAQDALLFFHALHAANQDAQTYTQWRVQIAHIATLPIPIFPLKGKDLLAKGLSSGRLLGEMLERAKHLWIEADFPEDPSALNQILEKVKEGNQKQPKEPL